MIDKKEIEKAKNCLSIKIQVLENSIESTKYNKEYAEQIDVEDFIEEKQSLETVLQYISELESENYEQSNTINNYIEIEKEHQKLVGELIEENKALEEQKK